ncbi:MAG TPA: hypothetical protein VGJ60_07180 [Chloroflexota bacterium]
MSHPADCFVCADKRARFARAYPAKEATIAMTIPERESRFDENHDGPECINCQLPMPEGARWQTLVIARVTTQGEMDTLDDWALCPDCETASPDQLGKFVRYALS